MALVVSTSAQQDIESALRSNNLTSVGNDIFFGTGGLSGTVQNTQINYDPITAPIISPADFPGLNASEIAAIQGQVTSEVDKLNLKRQEVINQANKLRQERIQQNVDTLATTQQLFSVVGGINPLQSGRNAAALTGTQAGVRSDLMNLFNQTRQQLSQLDIGAADAGLKGLQTALELSRQGEQMDFQQGLALSQTYGVALDQDGNLREIAGQTNVPTLDRLGQEAQILQNQQRIDLAAQAQYSELYGFATDSKGGALYMRQDGTPTSDANDPNIKRVYRTLENNPDGTIRMTNNPDDPKRDPNDLGTPVLFRNADMVAAQVKLTQQMYKDFQNAVTNQKGGAYIKYDDKGNASVNTSMFKYGFDLSEISQEKNELGTVLVTDQIEKMLNDPNPEKFSFVFNQVFTDQGGNANSVFFRANNQGQPAGYYMFEVTNPNVEIPQEIFDKLPGQNKSSRRLIDYIVANPVNNAETASILASLESTGGVKKLKTSEDIIRNLQAANGDDYTKRLMWRGMVGQQDYSSVATLTDSRMTKEFGNKLNSWVDTIIENSKNIKDSKNILDTIIKASEGTNIDLNPNEKGEISDEAQAVLGLINYGKNLNANYPSNRRDESKAFF